MNDVIYDEITKFLFFNTFLMKTLYEKNMHIARESFVESWSLSYFQRAINFSKLEKYSISELMSFWPWGRNKWI
jgi:hypothetical protein